MSDDNDEHHHDHVDHNLDDPADDNEHHDIRPGKHHVHDYHYHHTGDVVDEPVVYLHDGPCDDHNCSRDHVNVADDDRPSYHLVYGQFYPASGKRQLNLVVCTDDDCARTDHIEFDYNLPRSKWRDDPGG